MFIQARKLSIARGFSENKFKTSTLLPQQPGFDSIETYVRESEEVIKWGHYSHMLRFLSTLFSNLFLTLSSQFCYTIHYIKISCIYYK
jgi:hypothetical protein